METKGGGRIGWRRYAAARCREEGRRERGRLGG